MKRFLFILSILCLSFGQSQVLIDNTGTENASPHESAILDLKSEDKGLLLPRISNRDSLPAFLGQKANNMLDFV